MCWEIGRQPPLVWFCESRTLTKWHVQPVPALWSRTSQRLRVRL